MGEMNSVNDLDMGECGSTWLKNITVNENEVAYKLDSLSWIWIWSLCNYGIITIKIS